MRLICAVAAAALAVPMLAVATSAAQPDGTRAQHGAAPPGCDPFTEPEYAGDVPSPASILGFDLGEREVTLAESNRYLAAVDRASPRVRAAVMATSAQGRELRYAVVGRPSEVRAARAAAAAIRSGRLGRAAAERIAASAPAIAWVAGNVHGNEESGTDASLQVLRDLSDRTDCAATTIGANTVVVIVPTQNPDGRVLDYRRNSYGFDLNRDWFARTQPETDGKVELLRRYPSALFIDDHEMGNDDFFFPPNADPVHHEIADRSISWINNVYGASMADEFDRQGIAFFNYDIYDLLYMGYGDTVPTTGFLGAGMTFEKNNADPIDQRLREQYVAVWTSLTALADRKQAILTGWAASYRQAVRQGRRGELEPNRVFAPGSTVEAEVPDEVVRSYFIEPSRQKSTEVQALVRRLQRMDVRVRQLTKPLTVRDYRPYGEGARRATLPVGSYWISMAQPQKHWIQAMLGESSYVPFPYFYDVTAWSAPLLFNVVAGRSGAVVHPASRRVPLLDEPAPPQRPAGAASVGVWLLDPDSTSAYESEGWMRWLFDDKWRIPFRSLTTRDVVEGGLAPIDVLVVPDGDAQAAYRGLGPDGRIALRQWIAVGGRFIGIRGGTELAARLELTTARLESPTSDVPGSLIRAYVEPGPLARGVGDDVWSFYEYDNVMRVTDSSAAAVRFPGRRSPDFFVSGFQRGARELARTAAVADEAYGAGRVVVFAGEPNYRNFTDGTQKVLWNAIYGRDPALAGSPDNVIAKRAEAATAARGLTSYDGRMVVTVRSSAAPRTQAIFTGHGLSPTAVRLDGSTVRYLIDVGSAEESPFARRLVSDLAKLGRAVLAVRVP